MTQTLAYQYEVRRDMPEEYRQAEEQHIKERLMRKLLEAYDLSEPTTLRLTRTEEPGFRGTTVVSFRCDVRRVEKMEQVMVMPRLTEYDRPLWAIAKERMQTKWRKFKRRWWPGVAILLALLFVAPAQAADKAIVPSWGVSPVTYYVGNYPTIQAKRVVDRALYHAFQSWSQVCDIRFLQVKKPADANVLIWFDARVPGGLAQLPARPLYTGQSNIWLNGAADYNRLGATYLQRIAAHEVGHSIGLWHTTRTDQLMSEVIIGVFVPQWEDKARAVRIYGGKR